MNLVIFYSDVFVKTKYDFRVQLQLYEELTF